MTFATGLRSILRQDPDVIMVGEIRDSQSAEIAIQAALTGHLVFSTLHTNDSFGALTRLLDMEIEPFLVSSSVLAVLAQRLVRIVCTDCRERYTPTEAELARIGVTESGFDGTIYRPLGCNMCRNTGYRGRTAVHELMVVDDDVRKLVMDKADGATIRRAGTDRVKAGQTTIEELLRVTQEDIS
jgi:general secretion pathway protein E